MFAGRSVRADARLTRRFQAYSEQLEQRIGGLEHELGRERGRRVQLEDVMRAAGLTLPPWRPDNAGDVESPGLVIPLPRRAR